MNPQRSARALTLTGLALLLPGPAQAERPDPIDKVVVFGDRAQTTRKTQVACEGGQARAVFFPLPEALQPQTLRGAAEGRAEAVGTTARQVNVDVADDARLGPLQAALDALEIEARALEDAQALLASASGDAKEFQAHLVTTMNEGLHSERPPIDRWAKALDTLETEALERVERDQDLAQQAARLEERRQQLQRQLSQAKQGSGEAAWRAEVAVDCKGAARATVTLSYIVPGATWRPEYDLRFTVAEGQKTGPGEVELRLGALIQQATGEDWDGVTLVLSSARPWLGVEAPRPRPLKIYGSKGSDKKVLVQAEERRERADAGGAAEGGGPTAAALDDKGQSITLTLPHKAQIAADGRPYWAPVDSRKTRGEVKLVAVPKRSRHVYQVVAFKNPAPYPLLAGRTHTWRNGTFVGRAQLTHKGPGAPIETSLGIDGAFKAERQTLEDSSRKPGFLSSTRALPRRYSYTLTNRSGKAVTLELRDHLPVSKVADIQVSVIKEATTAGYGYDALTGHLTWPVKLAATGETTVTLGYRITLPEDWKIQ